MMIISKIIMIAIDKNKIVSFGCFAIISCNIGIITETINEKINNVILSALLLMLSPPRIYCQDFLKVLFHNEIIDLS